MLPLDFVAAGFTMTSTALLALRRRSGFVFLVVGSLLWLAVSLLSEFSHRAVYGQTIASCWTLWWACRGWKKWK